MKDYYKVVVKRDYPDKPFKTTKYKSWWKNLKTPAKSFIKNLMFDVANLFGKKIEQGYMLNVRVYIHTNRDIVNNNYAIAMAFYNNKYCNIMRGGKLQFEEMKIVDLIKGLEEFTEVYFKPVKEG